MSDIKLFRYSPGNTEELAGKSVAIEKTLQNLIESQMETFFGVRFLAGEYVTGAKHRGRIDSLGLDENGEFGLFDQIADELRARFAPTQCRSMMVSARGSLRNLKTLPKTQKPKNDEIRESDLKRMARNPCQIKESALNLSCER